VGILSETSETSNARRRTAQSDEPDPTVRFFWRIAFFALVTWIFARERLNAPLSAAQDFSVVEWQLAAVQGDISPAETRRQNGLK
jgi:hypothetical protein